MVEAIEVNFDGTIDDLKIEKTNSCRDILVNKIWSEHLIFKKVCALVTNDAYFAIKIGDNMQQSKDCIVELTLNINLTFCKANKTVTT